MSSDGVRGVVVGHGAMAEGLVSAVRRIAGSHADSLTAVSNNEKGPAELREELDQLFGDEPVVVFVDLQAGSCGMAALSCCRGSERRVVICGVNLPVLLDFVFNRELPLGELADRLVDVGRTAITRVPQAE